MSLIKCPECGEEISSLAESCPHCGCPLKPTPVSYTNPAVEAEYNFRTVMSFISGVMLVILGIVLIVVGIINADLRSAFISIGILSLFMSGLAVAIGLYRWHQTH